MIRRLFTAASALSLLLGVAIAVIWVRSYWFADGFGRSALDPRSLRYTCIEIVIQSGRIAVSRTRQDFDRESFPLWDAELRSSPSSMKPGLWHQPGGAAPRDQFRVVVTRTHNVNRPYQGWEWFWSGGIQHRRLQERGRYSETVSGIEFPCGYLVVLCLIAGYPAMKALFRVIRGGRHPGLCRYCGYDLRASTERCPECGTPIPSNQGTTA